MTNEWTEVKISGMMGKGYVRHNNREIITDNVDRSRTRDNVYLEQKDIEDVYHELFDEALAEYNSRKKKTRDKIDDYYQHIKNGKQEKPFYEAVFQIGNLESFSSPYNVPNVLAKNALIEFYKDFVRRNPHLRVFNAVIHMDESTPHLHIDFVPFTTDSKRGLSTRVSLKQALKQQGFESRGTKKESEWTVWMENEKAVLEGFAENQGNLRVIHGEGGRKHLSVTQYKEVQREVEKQKKLLEKENDAQKRKLDERKTALDEQQDNLDVQRQAFEDEKSKHALRVKQDEDTLKAQKQAFEDEKSKHDLRVKQDEKALNERKTALDEQQDNLDAQRQAFEDEKRRLRTLLGDPNEYVREHERLERENKSLKERFKRFKEFCYDTLNLCMERFLSLISLNPYNKPNYPGFDNCHYMAFAKVAAETCQIIGNGLKEMNDEDCEQYAEEFRQDSEILSKCENKTEDRAIFMDILDYEEGRSLRETMEQVLEDEQGYEAEY